MILRMLKHHLNFRNKTVQFALMQHKSVQFTSVLQKLFRETVANSGSARHLDITSFSLSFFGNLRVKQPKTPIFEDFKTI